MMAKPRIIEVEGHSIAALSFNEHLSGTPIIFIHGITSSVNMWVEGQIPYVNDNFRWYSLSLPGHFPSELPEDFTEDELSPEMIGRVLTKAITQLVGDQSVILIGHSTGGFAVLNIAAYAPEMVERGVCIAGFAQGDWTGVLGLMQRLARLGGSVGTTLFKLNMSMFCHARALSHVGLNTYIADRMGIYRNPVLAAFLDSVYAYIPNLNTDSMLKYFKRMPDIDISDNLACIKTPMLVISGDKDPIVPVAQSPHH